MKGGVILVAIGLFLAYLGVSGKYCCITRFGACAASTSMKPCACEGAVEDPSKKAIAQATSFADLLRPLEVPGMAIAPYNFNLF